MPARPPSALDAGAAAAVAGWAEVWGLPGLADRVRVAFSGRLSTSLGRCVPSRRVIRLNPGLRAGPRAFLLEILCHELAHVAAWELHGEGIRPHGREWQGLVRRAGYRPTTRLEPPPGVMRPAPRRRRRRRYLYDHRCAACGWRRLARAAVRRWRCPRCAGGGDGGRLEIWRLG
jgi:SprT protein